jgi:hypothetical protein
MWSIPFDYNLFENWFGMSEGHNTYDDMYYKKGPTKAGENLEFEGKSYRASLRMIKGGESTLICSLLKK